MKSMNSKWLFVIIIIGLILISGCNKTPTGDVVADTQQKGASEVKEKNYAMNQNVPVDYMTYRIIGTETFTEMGTSMFKKETNGKFVKVYLDVTNNAKETKQVFTPRFKIEDNQGRKYDRLSDDMMYISDYLEFGAQLQPSLTKSGAIVFELPKDSIGLKLIISGDWLSNTEIKVDLPYIRDIGKDTTQKEKQDKMLDETMQESEKKIEEEKRQAGLKQLEEKQEDTSKASEEYISPTLSDSLKELQDKLKDTTRINSKINECTKTCAGEYYNIPAVKNEFYMACYQVYYYGGEEELNKYMSDCK